MRRGEGWRRRSFRWSVALGTLAIGTSCCKPSAERAAQDAQTLSTSVPAHTAETPPAQQADSIYQGGRILTMEGDAPAYVEAVAVKDGKIQRVGARAKVERLAGPGTQQVDLAGKALLPGFIDGHGHVFMVGIQKLSANLLPPPDGGTKDIVSLRAALAQWRDANARAIEKTGWIVGFGYDDSQLAEKRHPTAKELDQVSSDVPILIIHQSGHLAVMNSAGLKASGITAASADPPGGVIRRAADGRTPNGVLEEMAFFQPVFKVLGRLDQTANERIALAGAKAYAEFGFTTAQDGRATQQGVEIFQKLAKEGRLEIDVVSYPDLQANGAYMQQAGTSRSYQNHFRIGGVKLSFDGSPQGKTAWLTQPYLRPPPGKPASYAGYPAIPDAADREALVAQAYENDWQLLAHCNGDAAADAMIDAVGKAVAKYGKGDRRTVMIHAQTVREDQLDRMKELGIMPSFFTMHTFYWGDWHSEETLGPERASRISPTGSALERQMKFTTHHDAPVALPSSIMILHTTVNRTSRSGKVIGPNQRVSAFVALKSLTEWGAWQYFEADQKGTISQGKLADFVILDKDPIQVDPAKLKDLRVLETIKEGRTVYRAE